MAITGDFSGLVDIDHGRRLYLECRGTGSPTVILESGYRTPGITWRDDLAQPDNPRIMTMEGVAGTTRVCTYDRPGTPITDDAGTVIPSRSDDVPMPRSMRDVVADLHALIDAAGITGPIVLVGHSLGGMMVRLYAATYPDDIVGMVLVDPFSELLQETLGPTDWAAYLEAVQAVPPAASAYSSFEVIDIAEAVTLLQEATAITPLPSMPFIVLTRGVSMPLPDDPGGEFAARVERGWRASHDLLVELVPGGELVVATESGHYIMLDQPELVIASILEVVDASRSAATSVA